MVGTFSFVELDIRPLWVLYSVERIIQIDHLLYTVVLLQYFNWTIEDDCIHVQEIRSIDILISNQVVLFIAFPLNVRKSS